MAIAKGVMKCFACKNDACGHFEDRFGMVRYFCAKHVKQFDELARKVECKSKELQKEYGEIEVFDNEE